MLKSAALVGRLKRRDCDRHGLGLKPTRVIRLCPWERHVLQLFPLPGGFGKQFLSPISIKIRILTGQQYIGIWKQVGVIACPMYRPP